MPRMRKGESMSNKNHCKIIVDDGAFSIDIGLEPIGVVGPICWAGSPYNLQPALKG